MRITVEVHDPRRDPEPADWPAFMAQEQLYPPWEYGLMAIESRAAGNPTMLAVARQDGRIVAAFAMTVCRPGRAGRSSSGPVGGPARLLPGWVEVHQPWLSAFPGWAFAEPLDPPTRREIVREFERALRRSVGLAGMAVVYRNLPPADEPLVARRIAAVRDIVGTTMLDNSFTTVEDWISSLSRGRRHAIRGQLRTVAADPDLVVRFAPARDDLDGRELAVLLRRHQARLGRPRFDHRSPVSADYLTALIGSRDVHTLTYHDGAGRLLAFATLLDHPVVPAYQHWAARARDDGGRKHLYFDAYARIVRHMVQRNRKALSGGRGMLEVKNSLGFATRPLRIMAVPAAVVRARA